MVHAAGHRQPQAARGANPSAAISTQLGCRDSKAICSDAGRPQVLQHQAGLLGVLRDPGDADAAKGWATALEGRPPFPPLLFPTQAQPRVEFIDNSGKQDLNRIPATVTEPQLQLWQQPAAGGTGRQARAAGPRRPRVWKPACGWEMCSHRQTVCGCKPLLSLSLQLFTSHFQLAVTVGSAQ